MAQVTYRLGRAGDLPRKDRGLTALLKKAVWTAYLAYCQLTRLWRSFTFQGRSYKYFYRSYNQTFRNERVVEVPIALELLRSFQGKTVLEVGNVLSHYFPVTHDIVDKYEKAPGVLSMDIADFRTRQRYDLILCISTLEHVGWDEKPRRPLKALAVLKKLRGLLKPHGTLFLTFPVGANPHLDAWMKAGRVPFNRFSCLKRISRDNQWREEEWSEVRDLRYESPYPCANGLVIGTLKRS